VRLSTQRAHEHRVAVDPGVVPAGRVAERVRDVLGGSWSVRAVAPGSPELLAVAPSEHPVGSAEYAEASFAAARRLRAEAGLAEVEADVPIPWREEAAALPDSWLRCTASSASPGWARDLLGWQTALEAMDPDVRGGVGVSVGHPDSGYTLHPSVGADTFDLLRDRDVIDGDDDALDDLRPNPFWPLPNPGHGTSTASVIAGRRDPASGIAGVAPAATVVPVRATESVVQLFDSDVAAAVRHARQVGCHVVSMSLGGKGFFGLRREVERAVASGMVVMAAAGNAVGFVTAPASYDSCLAVAATGPDDVPWPGSSRGEAVDVSMPGHCVWVAGYLGTDPVVGRTHGTSYAVAHLAGAAALWLAHHGHEALAARYGVGRVQAAFLATLLSPGVCAVPGGWDDRWGAGRVDLAALLDAGLPEPSVVARTRPRGASPRPGDQLAATLGRGPGEAAIPLDGRVHESELVYRAMAGLPESR